MVGLPAIKYGIQNISPDYSFVNIESQWTTDAGNGRCWILNSEVMKVSTDTLIGLHSEIYYGHEQRNIDPSLFSIPSFCLSYSRCF
jgi:hypothetical protein